MFRSSLSNKNSTDGKTNQGGTTEELIELTQLSQSIATQGDGTKGVVSDIEQQQQPQNTITQDDDTRSDISDDDRDFADSEEYPNGMSGEEYFTLQKEARKKFGQCIKNGTIDEISIEKRKNGDLCTKIKLDNTDNNTGIKVSEFLNSEFCKNKKITGLLVLDNDGNKIISCYVEKLGEKDVRRYDLGTTGTHGMLFKWSVDGRECSIILTANSDGSIKIVGDKPTDQDLEKNAEVRINVKGCYVTLADAVQEALKVQNQHSKIAENQPQPQASKGQGQNLETAEDQPQPKASEGQNQHSETAEDQPQLKASEGQNQHSETAEDQPQPKASEKPIHGEFTQREVERKTQPKEEPSISPK